MTEPIATAATPFQAGLLCPACQATIAAGEAIITCQKCATTHHASCWAGPNRCSSYHCDTRTSAQASARVPEIKITADETANAVVPAKRVPLSTEEVAQRALKLQASPTEWSKGAVVLAALVGATNTAATGAFIFASKGRAEVAIISLVGILFCFILGIASAVTAGNLRKSRSHRGAGIALLALLGAIPAAVLFIASIVRMDPSHEHAVPFDLAAPEPPAPETFEHAPAPIANAMRANVFVQGHEMTGRSWCGAGVVLGRRSGRTYLLTNKHVTDPFASGSPGDLSVTFASGEIVGGHVDWSGPEGVDLAVMSCNATRPPRVVTRVRRAPLTVGEKSFAIGNPHSLAWTYTEGVISRVYAKHTNTGRTLDVLQTQTPIHPGNSGGGLYDAQGRLVGINTWVILSEDGPGFAISAKTILDVVPRDFLDITAEDTNEKGDGE